MGDIPVDQLEVEAWAVQDTGLAPAPPRFRRLPGALRHHRGSGPAWPPRVRLRLADGHLEIPEVGRWPLTEVRATLVGDGPPLTFALAVPDGTRLLATAATGDARRLLAALT
ncbi:MAG TPA: hypothetical protein VK007_04420 [Acidimicrobiales bacterium]|nr:hypothetical protein [Acidimicrobiales bacterium]